MKVERVFKNIRYTLSNENLSNGDKVYPIAEGRTLDDGSFILHDFSWEDYMSGFPDEPHIILNINYSDYKPYEVQTDMGFSPVECYYKIIKKEKQVPEREKREGDIFAPMLIWVEIS